MITAYSSGLYSSPREARLPSPGMLPALGIRDCGNDPGNVHVRLPDAHDLPWPLVYVKKGLESSMGGHALAVEGSTYVAAEFYSPMILTNPRFRRRPSNSP